LAGLWADSSSSIALCCEDGRPQTTALPIRLDLDGFRDVALALVYRNKVGWTVTEMHTGLAIGSSCGVGTKRPLQAVDAAKRRLAKVGRWVYDDIVRGKRTINDDVLEAEIVL
jgi:hypothetical protein